MTSKSIKIDLVSDFACPWCLVGLHRLRKAIDQRPELDIALSWRPFQLNPDMPREGRNRRDYYHDKFGQDRARALREALDKAGAEEGITFCDTPDAMAPNTLSAHVLMSWAAEENNVDKNALAEKIFDAHHIECENIGRIEVLARIAGEAGMDKSQVSTRLAAGDDEDKVKQQIHQAAADGISAVPFFIVNDKYGVSGAQPSDVLVSILDRVSNARDQQDSF